MKQKNPLVSITTKNKTKTSSESSVSSSPRTLSLFGPSRTRSASAFHVAGSSGATASGTSVSCCLFLVNLSRLLVPFLVLISSTCCTTTNSLSPFGFYKVGIGATNLVENILGNGSVKTKTTIRTTDSLNPERKSGIVNQITNRNSNSKSNSDGNINSNQKEKDNAQISNKNKNKSQLTKKRKRQDKNKNSIKRSNSDNKKRNTRGKDFSKTTAQQHYFDKSNTEASGSTIKLNNDDNDTKNDDDNSMLRIPGISEDDQKFLDRVQASKRTVQNWEVDEEVMKKCRSLIPWEELLGKNTNDDGKERNCCNSETDRLLRASDGCFGANDFIGGADSNALFLQRLCRWFQSYMSWVNAPPCKVCGCTETEMKTVRGPETKEEEEGQAKRVEVYYCPECKDNTTTFPRYNKASKLLETRQGRCGEYANLFGQFCRSVGFETRLVLDWSDHLWTEVRLGDSWVMADACEGVIDKPSMYEHGWGKDGLCYMVGIGRDHVVDVTPRYTRKFMTNDFQTRRRTHTSSEESSENILQQLNERMKSQPTALAKSRVEELERRQKLEDNELRYYKQATEWTEQEKYGSGRISGSLAWRRSRREAGISENPSKNNSTTAAASDPLSSTTESQGNNEVAGFPVEAFVPARLKKGKVSFRLTTHPTSRHDGIVVSDTPCAVGVANSISVVVVDNNDGALGCILQSKSFMEWEPVAEFVEKLPSGRIVLINGKIEIGNETKPEDFYKDIQITRLGGWNGKEVAKSGVLFAGQVDAHPDWTFSKTHEGTSNSKGNDHLVDTYEVEIDTEDSLGEDKKGMQAGYKLRTERSLFPQRIAGRLPDAFMPLSRQLSTVTEKEKREAYLKFAESHGGRYCGYTTKKDSPVYLLDSTAYPLQNYDSSFKDVSGKDNTTWNTFLELPEPLVPSTDYGIDNIPAHDLSAPIYEVPLDTSFFNSSLGPNLLSSVDVNNSTADALTNARLIGLYFSAHWCGPCRSFTPMLAEMYEYLKETFPTHGLEIVFVSGDRDEQSFRQYYNTMPWKSIPFDQLQFVKQALNVTYGVRGIPSFVVLDAVSGQAVVSANESRQQVVTACRGGDLRIEAMFQSWLGRTPASTQELLSMIELSAREIETKSDHENDTDPDDNPYLRRIIKSPSKTDREQEISIRFKAEFEKLINAGHDPNSAAAKALTTISESPMEEPVSILRASYAGKSRSKTAARIEEALAHALERNSASAVSDALAVARKYLRNSQRVPWEPKFRRFPLSNKVADKITRVEGGLGLLQSLGFEVIGTNRDFEGSIPIGANLDAMNTKITQLIDDLKAST